jgi:hypothetical protein
MFAEIEELGRRGAPHRVEVWLGGSFARGAIRVEDVAFTLDAIGRGSAMVWLSPPTVEVSLQLVSPGPGEYAFTLAVNGHVVYGAGDLVAAKERPKHLFALEKLGVTEARRAAAEGTKREDGTVGRRSARRLPPAGRAAPQRAGRRRP